MDDSAVPFDVPTPRETAGEVLSDLKLLPQEPFEQAVFVARHLPASVALPVPARPPSRFSPQELDRMSEHAHRLEGVERLAVEQWAAWRLEAGHAREENVRRLRGLLWTVATLARKPGDERAATMLGRVLHFLDEEWGYTGTVPDSYVEREAEVQKALARWRR